MDLFDNIDTQPKSENDMLQDLARAIDRKIYKNYKLWPSNYIAYDLYYKASTYAHLYDAKEKRHFERRLARRVNVDRKLEVDSFLLMYANPVIHKRNL